MNFKSIHFITILMFVSHFCFAQNVGIKDDNSLPNAHAILDIDASNNDKGILIPRLSTSERKTLANSIGMTENGLMVYDETSLSFWFWRGNDWIEISVSDGRLADDDKDTEIKVEESPDEDIIRFYIANQEKMTLLRNPNDEARLELLNTSNSIFIGDESGTNNNPAAISNMGIGHFSLFSNTVGFQNIAIGKNALSFNESGSFNLAIGEEALLKNINFSSNIAIGYQTLRENSAGYINLGIGNLALKNNTSGLFNIGIGHSALRSNIDGSNNIAIGYQSLVDNSSGNQNTALGFLSMFNNISGSFNTAIGYHSLRFNLTGEHNSAFGRMTLSSNTTGSYNTAVGDGVLDGNTIGEANTAVGNYALSNVEDGNYNLAIGFKAAFLYADDHNFCSFLGPYTDSNGNYENSTALGYGATITASNKVVIGNGSVNSIGGMADWTNFSDGRFKIHVQEDVPGLDFIMNLRPVTYQIDVTAYNSFIGRGDEILPDDTQSSQIQTGFIAQEVENVATQLGYVFSGVDSPESEKDHYGLRYAQFVTPLIQAMQEQQEIIEAMQTRIETLENQILSASKEDK